MEIIESVKKHKILLAVFVLLVLVVLKGTRVDSPSTMPFNFMHSETCSYTEPVHSFSSGLGELTLESTAPIMAAKGYVLTFELRLDEPNFVSFPVRSVRSKIDDYRISVEIFDDIGHSQSLQHLAPIATLGGYNSYDFGFLSRIETNRIRIFVSDQYGRKLGEYFGLEVRNLAIIPVDVSLITKTNYGLVLTASGPEKQENRNLGVNTREKIRQNSPIIGSVHKFNQGHISSVSLLASLKGNGGVGKYRLFVARFSEFANNKYSLTNVINEVEFTAEELPQFADETSDTVSTMKSYTFPLYAPVRENEEYLVGIDATNVSYNWEHYIELGYQPSKERNMVRGTKKELRLYGGALPVSVHQYISADQRPTPGARVVITGQNSAQYTYTATHSDSDLLAVDPSSTASVFFDKNNRTVLAKAVQNQNIIYSFNTIYPMKRISIEANQRCDSTVPVKLEYSLDNQTTWNRVGERQDIFPYSNQFASLDLPGSLSTRVYLRVSYLEERTGGSGQSNFGLTNLRIYADLVK